MGHYLVKGKLMLCLVFLGTEEQCHKCASCSALLRSQGVRDRYQQFLKQRLLQHPSNLEESVAEKWKGDIC